MKRLPIRELLDDGYIQSFASNPSFMASVHEYAEFLAAAFTISNANAEKMAFLIKFMLLHKMLPEDLNILKISTNENKIHLIKNIRKNIKVRIKVNIRKKTRKIVLTNSADATNKIVFKPMRNRIGGYLLSANWRRSKVEAGRAMYVMASIIQKDEYIYGGNTISIDALIAIAIRSSRRSYLPILAGDALLDPTTAYDILPPGLHNTLPMYNTKEEAGRMLRFITNILVRYKLSEFPAYIEQVGTEYCIRVPNILVKKVE